MVGSLTVIATRYLDLVLAREAIALNRIIMAEVTRFPTLRQIFWSAGPERHRAEIESFIRRAAAAGSLAAPNPRLAAGQFLALARGDTHLRSLLKYEDPTTSTARGAAVASALTTFLEGTRAMLRISSV